MSRFFRKPILILIGIFVFAGLGFFAFRAYAVPTTYYFNNAVNTSPASQGNYWLDSGHTTPAVTLPNLAEDIVFIASGSTYAGDAVLRGGAINSGTITGDADFYDSSANLGTINGDATFWEDTPENGGTVLGEQIRHYTSAFLDTYVYRDFDDALSGPWVVIADGVVLDMSSGYFDETTIFRTLNGGSFVYATLYSIMAANTTVVIHYDKPITTSSVPATTDFVFTSNGSPISVTNVSISGKKITLTLASAVVSGDTLAIDYTAGVNPILADGIPVPNLNDQVVFYGVQSEVSPLYSVLVGTKVYTGNLGDSYVTVTDTLTDSFVTRIPVIEGVGFTGYIGKKMYMTNATNPYSATEVDTTTDTVNDTFALSGQPYFSNMFGTKFYMPIIGTGVNKVDVLDTRTGVLSSINAGTRPNHIAAVGQKGYVVNPGSNNVTVFDLVSDAVLATIPVGTSDPRSVVASGTKVYVAANISNNKVVVIDTVTDTVEATITVGNQPVIPTPYGTKLYVYNQGSDSVSVINTLTNTVSSTIAVGDEPNYGVVHNGMIYVPNRLGNSISVIDAATDTVVDTVAVGTYPVSIIVVGNKLFIPHSGASGISIIDTTRLPHLMPDLVSFTSSTADNTYTVGDSINITANFGKTLASGSTMTVTLSTGDSVVLNNRSGSTLSGTYVVGDGDETPDLSVTAITSASVSDGTNTRTSYDIPSSPGSLIAEKSMLSRNLGDVKNIAISPFSAIDVGTNPYQISSTVTVGSVDYIYVANQGSDDVSVIRLSDNTVVDTIDVGSEPYGLTLVEISGTTYVYVANTGSDTVSVINTDNNSVVATIATDVKPYYVEHVGTKVYVTNGASNTVSVINANTNTVIDTISVGSYPRGIKAYGTDLYVANYGDPNYSGGDYISVIDSTTDEVTDTVVLAAGSRGPRGVTVLGTKVYVSNYLSHNVSVINTATNAITATVAVGNGPRGMAAVGTDIYVENFDDGTISVIDSTNNTVTDTIDVGHSPAGMGVVGTDIYYSRFQDSLVSILDTTTGLLETAPVGASGGGGGGGGSWGSSIPVPIQGGANTPSDLPIVVPPVVPPVAPPATSPVEEVPTSGSADFSSKYPALFAEMKNLKTGMKGLSILELQKYLNAHGFIVAKTGAGSPGKETNFYGAATRAAVTKFQEAHAKEILTPVGLKKGTGIFGPSTKKYILLNP
ncbi:MAG TPA: SwmB domain-containing protein [Candidatus Paceibacterota bacterium]|nr:SwmB domain-containing protein [Candidatus Paceibacterota bacterium]